MAHTTTPAPPARPAEPTRIFQDRADALLHLLRRDGGEDRYFSTLFTAAIPVAQWRALTADLRRDHGAPLALGAVRMTSASAGQVEIRYARATVAFTLVVAPQPPYPVIGLHLVGVRRTVDSIAAISAEIAALPGRAGFAVTRIGPEEPPPVASLRAGEPLAIGSIFKLYILAELARQVAAGERRWTDVAPLARKSFSGRLRSYPEAAPMTLHSLASAMIAESDNSAADTLLALLGREQVDAMVARIGPPAPRMLPVLSTAEAFALKMPANAALAAAYDRADVPTRRALLVRNAAALSADAVDVGSVAERPAAINRIEWFATPVALARLLDALHRQGGEALAIMAINPGIPPADAGRWRYLGYKGGSEPGVIAMVFLAEGKDGARYAVTGGWNDPAARVDEPRFVALMTRLLTLLASGSP